MSFTVSCFQCKQVVTNQWWLCPSCGGSLEVSYLQALTTPQFPADTKITNSLGEGNTALVFLDTLSQQLTCEVWAKCESQNPTGSFKDRGSVIEVTKAKELGKAGIVCASTGNMAASLAAYAARYTLKCIVVIPVATPESKLQQAIACGAQLLQVDGTYDDCVGMAEKIAQKENYFLCGDYVVRREGQKTIGWELAGKEFDGFIVPVGNGNVGIAIAQGLEESGAEGKLPTFIGVQAQAANPIEQAWKSGEEIKPQFGTKTVASACNVGNPLDGNLTLHWVKKTEGSFVTVTDAEIISAQTLLAKEEGLYVESTAAATLAGLLRMKDEIQNKKIALILTGTGLKESR